MNRNKASDRAMDFAVHRTWTRMYWAHQISRGLRRSLLVFGVTFAVFLPLTQPPPQPKEEVSTPITNEYGEPVTPVAPVGQTPTQIFEFPEGFVQVTNEPVNVDVPDIFLEGVQVVSMPPISKQWHRARFRNEGDTFWAIPTLDFELIYTRNNNPGTICTRDQCNVELTFQGDDFNLDGVPLTLNTSLMRESRVLEADTMDCRAIRPDHDYYLECLVFKSPATNESDLCLHIRRSEFLERNGEETVALDIRWDYMDDVLKVSSSAAKQMMRNRAAPTRGLSATGADWYPELCQFKPLVVD